MSIDADTSGGLQTENPSGSAEDFLARARPKLRELEEIRLKKLDSFNLRKKLAVPIGVVLTPILGFIDFWLVLLQNDSDGSAAGLTFVGLAALWGWVVHPKRQYANAYKSEILPGIAKLVGGLDYQVKGKISMEEIKPSKIVPGHTGYLAEDYFHGRHGAAKIEFSEITLRKKSGKSTVTVFRGLAILMSYEQEKFSGHTILTKDRGAVGEWFQSKFGNLEHADLVDPEFEDLFDVFTNDQVEARYLIDPVMVERLKALYSEYNGNKLMAAFWENKFLTLIGSHTNHFEPADIRTSALDETSIASMKSEVQQIISIAERLTLYDRHAR